MFALPQKRTLFSTGVMFALCQKRTFNLSNDVRPILATQKWECLRPQDRRRVPLASEREVRDVRFRSKPDIALHRRHVCLTPESGHELEAGQCVTLVEVTKTVLGLPK
jgi:hypothetical protein